MVYSSCGSVPFSYIVVVVDFAGRLVVEAFYGSDKVGIAVMIASWLPTKLLAMKTW